jgi:hypothetical protein
MNSQYDDMTDEEVRDMDCDEADYRDEDESHFGPDYDYGDSDGRLDFADPGGTSALRRATPSNPRNLPCPTCCRPNVLTPADRACGYCCDACADRNERGGY